MASWRKKDNFSVLEVDKTLYFCFSIKICEVYFQNLIIFHFSIFHIKVLFVSPIVHVQRLRSYGVTRVTIGHYSLKYINVRLTFSYKILYVCKEYSLCISVNSRHILCFLQLQQQRRGIQATRSITLKFKEKKISLIL